jgi:hypothetical protein
MYAPADDLLLLEAIRMVPFPEDPSCDAYEVSFPENDPTDIVLYGIVTLSAIEQSDAGKMFSLTMLNYIQDLMSANNLEVIIDNIIYSTVCQTSMTPVTDSSTDKGKRRKFAPYYLYIKLL